LYLLGRFARPASRRNMRGGTESGSGPTMPMVQIHDLTPMGVLAFDLQRGLTQAMRDAAAKANDIDRMQAWAGQSAGLAPVRPAGEVARDLWEGAQALLR